MKEKFAIIIDAGFLKIKLRKILNKTSLTNQDIVNHCDSIISTDELKEFDLFRVYYYDCPPFQGNATNPFSKEKKNLGTTPFASQNQQVIDKLELEPAFAIRKGHLILNGWKIGGAAMERMAKQNSPTIEAEDLVPDLSQKQVDMKIGLDIAWLSI